MDIQNFKKYMEKNVFYEYVLWNYGHIRCRIITDPKELNQAFTLCELPINTVAHLM